MNRRQLLAGMAALPLAGVAAALAVAPSPPMGFVVDPPDPLVIDTSGDATRYEIHRSYDGVNYELLGTTDSPHFVVTGDVGRTQYLRMRASRDLIWTSYSDLSVSTGEV